MYPSKCSPMPGRRAAGRTGMAAFAAVAILLGTVVTGGCGSDDGTQPFDGSGDGTSGLPSGGVGVSRGTRFRITVANLTDFQQFSPPIFVTHNASVDLFQVGQPASFGIQRIAEEGNIGPLSTSVVVPAIGTAVGSVYDQPSILPGQSRTFTIETNGSFPLLSAATMLVRTNDGFTGLDAVNLFEGESTRTITLNALDAGTENNNERRPFLIALEGTERDPENGVIRPHPTNVQGTADAPKEWDWNEPVARITIERL